MSFENKYRRRYRSKAWADNDYDDLLTEIQLIQKQEETAHKRRIADLYEIISKEETYYHDLKMDLSRFAEVLKSYEDFTILEPKTVSAINIEKGIEQLRLLKFELPVEPPE